MHRIQSLANRALFSILFPFSVSVLSSTSVQAESKATSTSNEALTLIPLHTPAQSNSLAPRLSTAPDGQHWLSWVEKDEQEQRLKISPLRLLAEPLASKQSAHFSAPILAAKGKDWFVNWADTPHLYVGSDEFMAAQWLQKSGAGTYAYDVRISVSNDGGKHWQESMVPHNDGTASEHGFLSFFPHAQGAGMVWLDGRNTVHEQAMTLRGAVLNAQGELSHEAELDIQVCDCCQTGATSTQNGAIAVYRNRSDAEVRDIYAVRFDGTRWGEPIAVHDDGWTIAGCPVNGPQVVSIGGEAVVMWYTMANDQPRVKIARSTHQLSSFTPPVTLAEGSTLGRVALSYTGQYIVAAWIEEQNQQAELILSWLNPDTLTVQHQDRIASVPQGRASGFPALSTLAENQVLIAWTGRENDALQVQAAIAQLQSLQ